LISFPGCGNGKYLNVNPSVFNIGSDRCKSLAQLAREKDNELLHCDNLALPFRDESLDAVLSVAVIHHIATVERRVRALRELARVLRVGGRVIISVWAMEQRHRKVGPKKH
jgi:ubiquinone/menaquinone biosynthesis C-methylase UbiE